MSCKRCTISSRVESSRDEILHVNVPLVILSVRHGYYYLLLRVVTKLVFRQPLWHAPAHELRVNVQATNNTREIFHPKESATIIVKSKTNFHW